MPTNVHLGVLSILPTTLPIAALLAVMYRGRRPHPRVKSPLEKAIVMPFLSAPHATSLSPVRSAMPPARLRASIPMMRRLDEVDLSLSLSREKSERRLPALQERLLALRLALAGPR